MNTNKPFSLPCEFYENKKYSFKIDGNGDDNDDNKNEPFLFSFTVC